MGSYININFDFVRLKYKDKVRRDELRKSHGTPTELVLYFNKIKMELFDSFIRGERVFKTFTNLRKISTEIQTLNL